MTGRIVILAGQYSRAQCQRIGDSWNLTGHIAGEPFTGVNYYGDDAWARCFHEAKRAAFSNELPRVLVARTVTRAGLQPVTIWKAV